jgi:hypothetical protein
MTVRIETETISGTEIRRRVVESEEGKTVSETEMAAEPGVVRRVPKRRAQKTAKPRSRGSSGSRNQATIAADGDELAN